MKLYLIFENVHKNDYHCKIIAETSSFNREKDLLIKFNYLIILALLLKNFLSIYLLEHICVTEKLHCYGFPHITDSQVWKNQDNRIVKLVFFSAFKTNAQTVFSTATTRSTFFSSKKRINAVSRWREATFSKPIIRVARLIFLRQNNIDNFF